MTISRPAAGNAARCRERQGAKLRGHEETIAERMARDRLTHHVHIIEMNGESFRLKQSKTKNKT